jgi:LuxR family transcriptional regulator
MLRYTKTYLNRRLTARSFPSGNAYFHGDIVKVNPRCALSGSSTKYWGVAISTCVLTHGWHTINYILNRSFDRIDRCFDIRGRSRVGLHRKHPTPEQGLLVNIHSLIQLLVLVEECRKAEAVIDELRHVVTSYGFASYGVLRYPRDSEDSAGVVLAGQWPDMWPQIYLNKKYVLSDPTMRYLAHAQRPFRWRDSLAAFRNDAHYRRMEQMMADAGTHGLRDGYSFPIYGRNGILGYMTLAGLSVDLSPVEVSLLDAIARKVFWRLLEFKGEAQALLEVSGADTRLTRREMEILRYLAEGLTSVEIGKQLKISNHTVDWYMNGLQEKLKSRNRQHAVAVAFRQGLIA